MRSVSQPRAGLFHNGEALEAGKSLSQLEAKNGANFIAGLERGRIKLHRSCLPGWKAKRLTEAIALWACSGVIVRI